MENKEPQKITREMELHNCFLGNLKTFDDECIERILEAVKKSGIEYIYGIYGNDGPGYYVIDSDRTTEARIINLDIRSGYQKEKFNE